MKRSGYFFAILITIIIEIFVLNLYKGHLDIPFRYEGDALTNYSTAKGIIDNGWFLKNKYLGAPYSLVNYDYPTFDNLHYLFLRVIGFISSNYSLAVNLYYLLLFPLTTITSLIVLRYFGVTWTISIFVSILFSFLPFRIMRNVGHLFLSAYYLIPFSLLVFYWLLKSKMSPPYIKNGGKIIYSLLISLVIGLSGLYYSYFYCFFLSIIAIKNLFQKKFYEFKSALFIILFTLIILISNIIPNINWTIKNGQNSKIAVRLSSEAEIYGLKIAKLFIPPNGKKIPFINNLRDRYFAQTQFNTGTEYLGIFGIMGFIILIFSLLNITVIPKRNQFLLFQLSYLNIFAILLSSMGGFGSIVAFAISPQIRAYDRMSIYIAFFSLTALALVLDQFYKKFCVNNLKKILFTILIIIALIIGMIDQTKGLVLPHEPTVNEYINDDRFIKSIEKTIPTGSKVFQLPYVPYPESVVYGISYDHLKPYLHSKNLYWSYGSIKGRTGDMWQEYVSNLPVKKLISTIYFSGFRGLYLDKNGYKDGGLTIEKELNTHLGKPSITSKNNRYLFYNLANLKSKFSLYDEKTLEKLKQEVLSPALIDWGKDFYPMETNNMVTWRWSPSKATLKIINLSSYNKNISFKTTFKTDKNPNTYIKIKSDIFEEELNLNKGIYDYKKNINVPPGEYTFEFSSNSKIISKGDSRKLSFSMINTSINSYSIVE